MPALNAGIKKIEEYYERMADSNAFIFAMCMCFLFPSHIPSPFIDSV
jgi:hypothetical protein